MRKILFIIFIFVVSLFYNSEISGYDWNEEILYNSFTIDKSIISNWRSEEDRLKKIKKVCLYQQVDVDASSSSLLLDKLKYLFIYEDGTASIAYEGYAAWCERGNRNLKRIDSRTSDTGVCFDGYKYSGGTVHRGIRNWSKNSDGVLENLKSSDDAYSNYQKTKECPPYLAHAEDGTSNVFYLASSSDAGSFSRADSLAKAEPGDKTYSYYNVGEPKNFTVDMTCDYSDKEDGDSPLITLDFSKEGNVKVEDGYYERKFEHNNETQSLGIVYINSRLQSSAYLSLIKNGKCPKTLDSCMYWYVNPYFVGGHSNIVIYGDSSTSIHSYCKGNDSMTLYCIGENCSEDSICQYYKDYYEKMKELLNQYNNNSKNKSKQRDILSEYNQNKEQLNSFCQSVLSRMNYSSGNCVQNCIDSTRLLSQLEIQYGLKSAPKKEKCNIGASILSMVYNVLKWAKYIAPILVIILSILDFIKAIAAQNDDDMKKAQGKFVKRLMVAALLFLLPLIINFMLKTFGLYSSDCDISDLFS